VTSNFNINVTFNFTVDHSDIVDFESDSKIVRNISISAGKLANCLSEYSHAVGFDLTVKQMLEVVFSNPDSMQDFIEITEFPDTLSRDRFCRAFGKYVLQDDRRWPIGYDPREYTKKFFDDLNEKGVALGYARIN